MADELELTQSLRKFSGTLQKLRINRRSPCEPCSNGFVLDANDDWLIVWQFHDFLPDGFTLIRVDGVTDIRFSDYERHWMKMLYDEGIATSLPASRVQLGNIQSMLAQLKAMQENFIIQCEDDEEDIEDFYVGRLITLDEAGCQFASFDALGNWDSELDCIPYDEITRIQWNTPYSTTFSKHLNGLCPHLISIA